MWSNFLVHNALIKLFYYFFGLSLGISPHISMSLLICLITLTFFNVLRQRCLHFYIHLDIHCTVIIKQSGIAMTRRVCVCNYLYVYVFKCPCGFRLKVLLSDKFLSVRTTVFILCISTSYLLTIPVLEFQIVHSTTC